jgi:hypothetical protein
LRGNLKDYPLIDEEGLYYHLPKELNQNLPLKWEPVLEPTTNESDLVNLKVERTLDID